MGIFTHTGIRWSHAACIIEVQLYIQTKELWGEVGGEIGLQIALRAAGKAG